MEHAMEYSPSTTLRPNPANCRSRRLWFKSRVWITRKQETMAPRQVTKTRRFRTKRHRSSLCLTCARSSDRSEVAQPDACLGHARTSARFFHRQRDLAVARLSPNDRCWDTGAALLTAALPKARIPLIEICFGPVPVMPRASAPRHQPTSLRPLPSTTGTRRSSSCRSSSVVCPTPSGPPRQLSGRSPRASRKLRSHWAIARSSRSSELPCRSPSRESSPKACSASSPRSMSCRLRSSFTSTERSQRRCASTCSCSAASPSTSRSVSWVATNRRCSSRSGDRDAVAAPLPD